METGLKGKRVLVAGGSRGIGRSIALAFAAEGANVSVCARSEGALRETEVELKTHGGQVHAAIMRPRPLACHPRRGDALPAPPVYPGPDPGTRTVQSSMRPRSTRVRAGVRDEIARRSSATNRAPKPVHALPVRPCHGSGPGSCPAATSASRSR